MDQTRVTMAILGLASTYRAEVGKPAQKNYWDILGHLDDRRFDRAVNKALQTCKFMPAPAELLDMAGPATAVKHKWKMIDGVEVFKCAHCKDSGWALVFDPKFIAWYLDRATDPSIWRGDTVAGPKGCGISLTGISVVCACMLAVHGMPHYDPSRTPSLHGDPRHMDQIQILLEFFESPGRSRRFVETTADDWDYQPEQQEAF